MMAVHVTRGATRRSDSLTFAARDPFHPRCARSGAEVIPFLKTYVQLPGAILFTILYSKMSNRMSQENVFYSILGSFLAFFASFALVI